VSRIGKNPITVPAGVTVTITNGHVYVKGPKGELSLDTHNRVSISYENNQIVLDRPNDSNENRAFHGLYQRLLSNIVLGVTQGFAKELIIEGVGYRAAAAGKDINFQLGYSHPILFPAPDGITLAAPEATRIIITGCDKQLVGQVAANIRALRKPEPYKGKGIRYKDEKIRRKVGKSGA
jgi:large subunit ribosomal protein L6